MGGVVAVDMPEPVAGGGAADETLGRSERKHRAILEAAQEMFLAGGYLGTNMDELAARSGVSKQTVYKHFGSKEALFVELVTSMTDAAGDRVHTDIADPTEADDLPSFLEAYADRQLDIVMTPKLLQLRRLVIGEVTRFPELAEALYEHGPSAPSPRSPRGSSAWPSAACSASTTRPPRRPSSTGSSWASP